MKRILKYGLIIALISFAVLVSYVVILMKTKGEAQIVHEDGKLHISTNWRTNAIYKIRIWENESDMYQIFTIRGGRERKFTLDLKNVPDTFRNLADSPSNFQEGHTYYIAIDIQYDVSVAASIRTQYFDFLFSEKTTKIPEIERFTGSEPKWLGH